MKNKDILLEFQDDYPDVLNGDNLVDVLKVTKVKKRRINMEIKQVRHWSQPP